MEELTPVSIPESGEPRYCPECGSRVADLASTCLMCGSSLDVDEAAPEEQGAPKRRIRTSIPWRGLIASILTVGAFVAAIGWLVQEQIKEQSYTPTPTLTRIATRPPTRTPTPIETPTLTLTSTPVPPRVHTVQSGDTCVSIAVQYGISLEVMQSLNPEKCSTGATLLPDDPLLLPAATPTPGPTPTLGLGTVLPTPECPILHVVQSGQTALGIAEAYEISLQLLEQANGGEDLTNLQVNQVLQVPCLDSTATPTTTVNPNATSTPIPKYFAPTLLSPPDGAALTASMVPLQWTAVSLLRDNEAYVVRLRRLDQDVPVESLYVRTTLVRLGEEYAPSPDEPLREYSWEVTVVREIGLSASGEPRYTAASFSSERRAFRWLSLDATATP